MKAKEWAEKLNGREYRDELSREEEQQAKQDNVLIVLGASDDLLDLCGAISDEFSAYDGTTVFVSASGRVFDPDENKKTFEFNKQEIDKFIPIKAVWSPTDSDASWKIETSVPSYEFRIYEDGDLYCIGLAIDMEEFKV